MDIYQILTMVFAITTILGGISITAFLTRGRRIKETFIEFVEDYKVAMTDNELSDVEKSELMDNIVVIIDEAMTIYQAIVNVIKKIAEVFPKIQ